MKRGRKIFLLLAILVVVLLVVVLSFGGRIPANSVLVLEIEGLIEDQSPPDPWARLTGPRVTVTHDVLNAIDHAARDARITGLVVKIKGSNAGWAKLDEIRVRLLEFQASGKPSICYLGDDILGNREYFLATGCKEVWLTPTAGLGAAGLMSSATFLRGSLDKLGVVPNMFGTGEYKTYRNQFTEKKFTPAHREMTESLLASLYQHYMEAAAKARKIDAAEFDRVLREGPYMDSEAIEKKLVDRVAHWDEVQDHFRESAGDWQPLELSRYVQEIPNEGTYTIAVVNATGAIYTGDSRFDSWEGYIMGSDTVAANLRRAREDDSVEAIVLRVDSPGGSVVGSEIIRREVQRAAESKPIVVSMSDTAASGGYWIAMSANKIVAEPSTITGSIGVVFGKMNIAGLYQLLGLSTDHYATSPNATILYEQQDFTPPQRALVERFILDTYATFKEGVADGRDLTLEKVEQVAQGRVWTGAQAKDLGLVDEFGGLDRALALARELAQIDPSASVRILRLPEERGILETILSGTLPTVRAEGLKASLERAARSRSWVEARLPFELDIR
ncbi:MAG: signal peptide peptidase SppA [Candidatus Acidiferrales bacterium]